MQAKDLHSAYEKKMKLLREELEGRRKLEVRISLRASAPQRGSNRAAQVHEIEERKNQHIQELMKKCVRAPRRVPPRCPCADKRARRHEKAFTEIKNYYNDITHNNLDLIKSLKEEASTALPRHACAAHASADRACCLTMPALITLLLAFGNHIGRRQRVAHRR